MNELVIKILKEIVAVDYLGRPEKPKGPISIYAIKTRLNCPSSELYVVLKRMHLNGLLNATDLREFCEIGSVTATDEGVRRLSKVIELENPIT